MSGPGHYEDYNCVQVQTGDDPNACPMDPYMPLYYMTRMTQHDPVFPFHQCCYELLSQRLTGSSDVEKLDKDLLYSIMHELSFEAVSECKRLGNIDYGDIDQHQAQLWANDLGTECFVRHPGKTASIGALLPMMLYIDRKASAATDLHASLPAVKNTFKDFPYDILYRVTSFLSDQDILNLITASWVVADFLANDTFWRQRLPISMPWFFELHEAI